MQKILDNIYENKEKEGKKYLIEIKEKGRK